MPRQTRFRPYVKFPSDQERLQRLRRFLDFLYSVYSSRERFLSDFNKLQEDLNMGTGTSWGRVKLLTHMEEKDLKWCQELQRQVRDEVEKNFDALPARAGIDLPFHPNYLVFQSDSPGGVFLGLGHRLGEEPNLEKIRDAILSRLAVTLLYGINPAALVRCAECEHYTVRSHPRGKIYCSPGCRVRSAIKTRQKTLQAAKTQKRQKSKQKEA